MAGIRGQRIDEELKKELVDSILKELNQNDNRRFTDIEKQIVDKMYFFGFNLNQIANVLGVTAQSVNTKVNRKNKTKNEIFFGMLLEWIEEVEEKGKDEHEVYMSLFHQAVSDVREHIEGPDIMRMLYAVKDRAEVYMEYKRLKDSMIGKLMEKAADTMDEEKVFKIIERVHNMARKAKGSTGLNFDLTEGNNVNTPQNTTSTTINMGNEKLYKETLKEISVTSNNLDTMDTEVGDDIGDSSDISGDGTEVSD